MERRLFLVKWGYNAADSETFYVLAPSVEKAIQKVKDITNRDGFLSVRLIESGWHVQVTE